ncbi:MAG: hypothetical protein GXY33_13850 [Phycisphaerae bacterium]|nr:hypothetical protein [Phycisphaerae bacterium]
MGNRTNDNAAGQFQNHAAKRRTNLLLEFLAFLRHNKKWWLLPILIVILVLGGLVMLSGTALAPFLYPLF